MMPICATYCTHWALIYYAHSEECQDDVHLYSYDYRKDMTTKLHSKITDTKTPVDMFVKNLRVKFIKLKREEAENKWKRDHSTFYRWFLNIGCLLHLVFVRRRLGSPMRGVWWRFQRFPSHNCISGLCHILKYFDLISLAWWSASLYYTKDIHADNEHLFLLCKFHYNVGERVNKFCQVLKSYYSIIFGRTVL